MTLAIHSHNESSQPTLNYLANTSAVETRSTLAPTVVFELKDRVRVEPPRPGYQRLSTLASRLADIPGREESLAGARKDLADFLVANGKRGLKAFRLERGLSQTAFAERIGSSQPYVARVEANPECAGLEFLRKICAAFGIDMNTANELLQ